MAKNTQCPKDLTKLEADGVYSVLPAGEARFKQLGDCGVSERIEKFEKVKSVKLKALSCKCFLSSWERLVPTVVDKKYDFKISKSEPREECRRGLHFILCTKPGDCYEPDPKFKDCSLPKYNTLACPKECFE